MAQILIVEDEANIRRVLWKILVDFDKNINISEAADGLEAISMVDNNSYDLVLCDIKMPKKDGIEVLEHIQKVSQQTAVVMISGHGDLETAVKAMRMGAYDYISKPPDLNHLLKTVNTALQINNLFHKRIKSIAVPKQYVMIGNSEAILNIHHMVEKVAPTMARVMIQGPNGSGKELVARALHFKSNRATTPFVEVNCAAIPTELIESELFGHIKGAFTSAHKDRKGTFEQAQGGTLFLDEIGDMSLAAQAKVLRALEEHKIQRVGSDKTIAVDVRVIAATNKNIKEEIKQNRFREDLYHRLAVIEIYVPELNNRIEDIPLLADHFLSLLSPKKKLLPDAVTALQKINWTGNIRQLRNFIERLHILGGNKISAQDVKTYTMT
ncbi:MAG: response regulator [Flavobacteriaceae bacterium]|jgi:two-component system nitrogen regulation response regulator NtrX|nr:response regulator [Flavobacteriaceae bacterium]MBJ33506.1 response regulator [Flavobacteriaceae bacterium]|tara:strand:+ start:901 stop:2046 length:1146 start_codon:yes stop_codon:yes gene_type:complete